MRVDPRLYVCRNCRGHVTVAALHANAVHVECTKCRATSQVFLDDEARCYVIRHGEFLRLAHSPIDEDCEPCEDWTLVDLAFAREQLQAAILATDFDVAKCSCRQSLAALERIAVVVEPFLTYTERRC